MAMGVWNGPMCLRSPLMQTRPLHNVEREELSTWDLGFG